MMVCDRGQRRQPGPAPPAEARDLSRGRHDRRTAYPPAPIGPGRGGPAPGPARHGGRRRRPQRRGLARPPAGQAVASKAKTAQAPTEKYHAAFVCFAPVESPQIAIAIVVENGEDGDWRPIAPSHAARALPQGPCDAPPQPDPRPDPAGGCSSRSRPSASRSSARPRPRRAEQPDLPWRQGFWVQMAGRPDPGRGPGLPGPVAKELTAYIVAIA